jgi:plasmid stabilization system protein ParE
MRVYWTAKAMNRLRRLQQVHGYLGQQHDATHMFVERLTRLADEVARDPESGAVLPYFEGPDVREVVDGAYRLVYVVLEDAIHVLTVRHLGRLVVTRVAGT